MRKIIIDENIWHSVRDWITSSGHEIIDVHTTSPGIDDGEVFSITDHHQGILLTRDKGFGRRIFLTHGGSTIHGVILIRIAHPRDFEKIFEHLKQLFKELPDQPFFAVISPNRIRQRPLGYQ